MSICHTDAGILLADTFYLSFTHNSYHYLPATNKKMLPFCTKNKKILGLLLSVPNILSNFADIM